MKKIFILVPILLALFVFAANVSAASPNNYDFAPTRPPRETPVPPNTPIPPTPVGSCVLAQPLPFYDTLNWPVSNYSVVGSFNVGVTIFVSNEGSDFVRYTVAGFGTNKFTSPKSSLLCE